MANKKLVFKDGTEFCGISFGYDKEVVGPIEFNTSMFGYQTVAGDPTNIGKVIVLTYPIIGNFGTNEEDCETKKATVAGVICHEYNHEPSNFRFTQTYHEYLEESKVPLLSGVDTRAIVRKIRDEGNQIVAIVDETKTLEEALELINNYEEPKTLVSKVSSKKKTILRAIGAKYNVACIDLGTKRGLLNKMNEYKCNVTVLPYNVSAHDILALNPKGLIITDGPGNPNDLVEVIETIKALIGKLPILAVGLGQLLVAKAYGLDVYELKHGHHGANVPVRNVITKKIEITGQNHNYTVCRKSFEGSNLVITHENVEDNTVEGFMDADNKVSCVLYRPWEQTCDYSEYIFKDFESLVKEVK